MTSSPITRASVVRAGGNQVSSTVEGEAVILDLAAGAYYGLDPVGTRIWTLIQEPVAVSAVCEAIVREYDVDPARCETDVIALLRQLEERGLVEVTT